MLSHLAFITGLPSWFLISLSSTIAPRLCPGKPTSLLSLTLSSACLFPGLCLLWEWKIGVQFPVESYSLELCFSDRAYIALTSCEIKTTKFIPVSFVLLLGPSYTRYSTI